MLLATLVTPNVPELAFLTQREIADVPEMEVAAAVLADRTGAMVLAKGGHLPGAEVTDVLIRPDGETTRWQDRRIETRNSHGTGCTLASAIATGLGQAMPIEAARKAIVDILSVRGGSGLGALLRPGLSHRARAVTWCRRTRSSLRRACGGP